MTDLSPPGSSEQIIDSKVMSDGTEFVLVKEGEHWIVRVAGRALMSSHVTDSEEALADHTLDRLDDPEDILIGGLGLGFTLRAVLDQVSAQTRVTVAELVPSLVGWNHSYVGGLNDHPLDDERCEVVIGNVMETIRASASRFDAIILDVDNGPVALSNTDNDQIYSVAGVRACHRALRPHGILAVWSAGPSPKFERTLSSAHFDTEVIRVAAREGTAARHVLFIARRLSSTGGKKRKRR